MTIGVYKMFPEAKVPTRGTNKSAGLDFYIPEFSESFVTSFLQQQEKLGKYNGMEFIVNRDSKKLSIKAHCSCTIPTGIKVKVPKGKALIFFNRSGIAVKKQLVLGACVVDEDYQGMIFINLNNISNLLVDLEFGEKIAQGLLIDVDYSTVGLFNDEKQMYADHESERGDGAMGSTDHK